MGSDLILKIAVPAPFDDGLEYLLPHKLWSLNHSSLIGLRVLVPLGRREVVGVIVKVLDKKQSDLLKNVNFVIMAGGKGTRLAPFTKVLPKPLLPIKNKNK